MQFSLDGNTWGAVVTLNDIYRVNLRALNPIYGNGISASYSSSDLGMNIGLDTSVVALKSDLSAYAPLSTLANYVDTSSNQTIGGYKTFSLGLSVTEHGIHGTSTYLPISTAVGSDHLAQRAFLNLSATGITTLGNQRGSVELQGYVESAITFRYIDNLLGPQIYTVPNTKSSGTYTLATTSDLSNFATITDLASLSSSVSTNTSNIANLTSQITDLASLTSSHTSQISQLTSDVANCVTLSQLSAYSPTSAFASVAFTGSYSDLSGLPTINSVVANPASTTQTLSAISIDGVGYSIPSGGGGGTAPYQITAMSVNTSTSTITLTISATN